MGARTVRNPMTGVILRGVALSSGKLFSMGSESLKLEEQIFGI